MLRTKKVKFMPRFYEATTNQLKLLSPQMKLELKVVKASSTINSTTVDIDDRNENEKTSLLKKRIKETDMYPMEELGQRQNARPNTPPMILPQSKKVQDRTAKTFFANERTLLSWLNTVTFLSIAGTMIMDSTSTAAKYAGLGMILTTILFAGYALFTYQKRLSTIQGQTKISFADKIGPPVLIVVLCIVLLSLAAFFKINGGSAHI